MNDMIEKARAIGVQSANGYYGSYAHEIRRTCIAEGVYTDALIRIACDAALEEERGMSKEAYEAEIIRLRTEQYQSGNAPPLWALPNNDPYRRPYTPVASSLR